MLALLRDGLDLAAIGPANDASGALAAWAGRAMGLRGLRLDDPGVRFELAHPLASWAWALLVAAAVGLAILTYWRLQGRRRWRFPLAGLRALAIVLLLLLLTGPRLVRPNLATEPDWLVVLIDRSASMTIPDAPGPGHERQTREF